MNKEIIKKTKTWTQIKKKINFSNEDIKHIKEGIKLYDLLATFREEKEKKALTNEKLAEISKIPRPEVSKILNGKVNVSLGRLYALARALNKELEIRLV